MTGPNYVLITLDSCRFDVAAAAELPTLSALGELRRARTMGCFTLPAHAAFFGGFLPNVMEEPLRPLYTRELGPLWRLSRARKRPRGDDVSIQLPGSSVPHGFRSLGYRTVGAGGVRWFSSGQLRDGFDAFHYWEPAGDTEDRFAVRAPEEYPLTNVGAIVDSLGEGSYFLFVNSPETHAPYLSGTESAAARDAVLEVCRRLEPMWNGKSRHTGEVAPAPAEFELLKRAQRDALEEADRRLGELFARLPRPARVVVCADHGEAFGENQRWGHDFPDRIVMEVPIWYGELG